MRAMITGTLCRAAEAAFGTYRDASRRVFRLRERRSFHGVVRIFSFILSLSLACFSLLVLFSSNLSYLIFKS